MKHQEIKRLTLLAAALFFAGVLLFNYVGCPAATEEGDKEAPAEVRSVIGIAGDTQITLNWRDPPNEDFNKVQITYTPGGNTAVEIEKGVQTAVVSGLANGTAYTFTLKTVDTSGNASAGVSSAAYTPAAPNPADTTPPAEVSGVNGIAGNAQITLNWTDPPDEDFNKVQITYTPGGNTAIEIGKGGRTAVVSGLTNGTAYTFTLKTVDTSGNTSTGISSAAYTPADTTPSAEVSGVNGIAGNAQITLNWIDPSDEDFERVEISRSPGNSTVRVAKGVQTAVINNLTNGIPYTFNLKTVDTSGNTSAGVNAGPYTPQASSAPSTVPAVYMTTDISSAGLMAVYNALGRTPAAGQNVAIKITTGEPPNSNYLRQALIGAFRQSVNGTYVECMTAYGGQRASIAMAKTVAANHGFTPFDLMDENGAVQIPTPSASTYLTYDIVGSHINNYGFMVVLSHFKGHAMGGFGGAIKNMSIGIGTREGKCWIHSHGTSTTSPWFSDDRFRQSMAEAAGAVANKFGNNIIYINVLNRLSVDCDCSGNPAEPDMHDIGILASLDPVAIDKASYDLVKAAPDNNRLGRRMDDLNGILQATHGAAIGLGSLEYNLVELD